MSYDADDKRYKVEEAKLALKELNNDYIVNSARNQPEELQFAIQQEINKLNLPRNEDTSKPIINRIKRAIHMSRSENTEKIKILDTAATILEDLSKNVPSDYGKRLLDLKNSLNTIKATASPTRILVNQLEKIMAIYPYLGNKNQLPRDITGNKTLLNLHQELSRRKEIYFNKQKPIYHDKYVVLSVAAKVIEGQATVADLNEVIANYPSYTAGKISGKTLRLVEATIQAAQDNGWGQENNASFSQK